ncbi:MAG TPA: helix-turn-helix transcriptional regulator, partial [Arenicellales bacterium]|nr:helix-turn-helix transcriptional regulator [Arenicellales bacterium]
GRTLQSVEASRLPLPIARLCHIVADIGNDKLVPEPPSHVLRNAWGEFHFRAYELESLGEHASNGLIGISLTWFKPMAAKILAAVKAYDLTTRQMQTCVLLIKGLTARDISKQLGVSESTVISHRKEIYGRMGVKNRSDLLNRLMAA